MTESKTQQFKYNKELLAWAAGFFDGEGSTYICKRRGTLLVYPTIGIGQNYLEPLEKFNLAIGNLGLITTKTDIYELKISNFEKVQQCIILLWPYLCSVKQEQAKRVLDEYKATRKYLTKAPKVKERPHGSYLRYQRQKCRCEKCYKAYFNYREYGIKS